MGHLGNNLFEYALGRIIAESLDRELIVLPGKDIPGWSRVELLSGIVDRLHDHFACFDDAPLKIPGQFVERPQIRYVQGENRWQGHAINLQHILDDGENHRIVLRGYFQRIEYYYPYKEKIKRWFSMKPMTLPVQLGSDDVVVHIRRSVDMFVLNHTLDLSIQTFFLA